MAVKCFINQCDLLTIGLSIVRQAVYGVECSDPKLCDFSAFYLTHLDEEERHTNPITKVVRRRYQFTEYVCITLSDIPIYSCDLDLTILS